MKDFQGWFSNACGSVYKKLIRQIPNDGLVAEIGVYKGRSTRYLCKECVANQRKIYAIDTWEGTPGEITEQEITRGISVYQIFLSNMQQCGYDKFVTAYKLDSLVAAEKFQKEDIKFDLVLLDGDHHYENVIKEIPAWLKCLKSGGIIGGHDYYNTIKMGGQGVRLAVDKYFDNKMINVESSVWYVQWEV